MTARPISVIQQQIIDAKNANINLYDPTNPDVTKRGLTSTSQVANWLSWSYIQAVCINLFEQVMVLFQKEIEQDVALAAPGTPQWLQNKVLQFQYSSGTPQYLQYLPDNSIGYSTVDETLRIISQCAVITSINKVVKVKVTDNGVPLTGPQITALNAFLDVLNFSGVQFDVISAYPDYFMTGVDIYYNGAYASVITSTIQTAISNYLANIPFNGNVTLSELEIILKAVPGVIDVVFRDVEIRPNSVAPSGATKMVYNFQTFYRLYGTFAGNVIADTAAGRTLNDTINYYPTF